jgi:AraC-like DNA-binding protein
MDCTDETVTPPAWLQRAREFMESRDALDLSVAQVAAVAGVSRVHLTRAFRAAYGRPPRDHLNAIRLRNASALLARGVPIAQAALCAGFADQSHFTRRFKEAFGVTPGSWQRARSPRTDQDAGRGAICDGS